MSGDLPDRRPAEAGPVYRALWDREVPVELFESTDPITSDQARLAMDRSLAVVRRRQAAGAMYGQDGVIADDVLADLAEAGYWGLRVPPEFGGSGASFAGYARFLAEMITINLWAGVLGSAQAGLGPVTTVTEFGTAGLRRRLLPALARGDRLGAFATTEPTTSSDLRAIRTEAVPAGDRLLVSGEKLLITNAVPGRLTSLLCRVGESVRMLMVELPDVEDDSFRTVRYTLRALRHLHNRGLLFNRTPVPAENLLDGDGLVIAYHALNHGRVSVCAGAAGLLRRMAGSLIPWVQTRQVQGVPIGGTELVRRRLGRLAARIAGCDAVLAWSAQLLDQRHRGEQEGVIAKVFGTEMLKEATVDMLLKTHGGRALLDGNLFADDVHELLAPTVYEGENEIITLGAFGALIRSHASRVLQPLARAFAPEASAAERARRVVAAREPLASYPGWVGRRSLRGIAGYARRGVSMDLDRQSRLAADLLQAVGLEISTAVRRHGTDLVARQATAIELAQRVHSAAAMLVVSRYGARQADPLVRLAAGCMAAELGQRLTGSRPSPAYHRAVIELGESVAGDRFALVGDVTHARVAMPDHLDRELVVRPPSHPGTGGPERG